MAGIYIHIPFCRSRCIYCGFYSTTGLELRQRYVDALCKEMMIRGEKLEVSGERIDIETIYFGGGTPSQLTIPQLNQLLIYINKVYSLTSHHSPLTSTEITIEVNPDDVTPEYATAIKQLGVNRVSMGAQTFDNRRLRFLNRRHTAEQVSEAVKILRQAGIQNISIDLMYGFPDETLEDWDADITQALALDVEHISSYCLMYEEGTPLYRLSNFARPSFRSRHNSSYWNLTPYIGLGAAAHSFDGKAYRRWNISDIRQYIEGIENGQPRFEEELLDENTRYNDMLTVALRTNEGLDLNKLSDYYRNYCIREAQHYINDGLLQLSPKGHLHLTRIGLFVSDMIISDLMLIEDV